MADGALSFVSWVRRGLATAHNVEDGPSASAGAEASIEIEVQFNGDLETRAEPTLELIGPGDIVGLDSRVIVRTWPKHDDLDAEFVSYALVEFDQADLPWRYTAAKESGDAAGAQDDHLRPWFSLVVMTTEEASLNQPTPAQKLAVLAVNNVSDLPSVDQLWAWSHTQFEGEDITPAEAKQKITGQPGLFTGRLMSPRLLVEDTEYIACIVPTFERGRQAGLGTLAPDSLIDALAPWDTSGGGFQLPVYFSWRFKTGKIGNFEDAARRIKPFVLPETVGRRDLDTSEPGLALPPASPDSLPVEGALMSVAAFEAGAPEWPAAERDAFVASLKDLLNAPDDLTLPPGTDPVLAPPLYAQWYAAQSRVNDELPVGSNPPWFHQLNVDPRNRVGGALGTKVIQNEQQALLAGGWDQVEEIQSLNDKLRVLQFTRGALTRIYTRHYKSLGSERYYHMTRKLHAKVTCGDSTLCTQLNNSAILPGFLSSQWLRFARAQGPIGRIQKRPELSGFIANLMEQFNLCGRPATEPDPPGGLHNPDPDRGIRVICERLEELIALGPTVTLQWGLLLLWISRRLLVSQNGDCWWIALKTMRYAIFLLQISIDREDVRRRCRWRAHTFGVEDILGSAPMPNMVAIPDLLGSLGAPSLPGGAGSSDNAVAAEIRAALAVLFQDLVPPAQLECEPEIDLEGCRLEMVEQLEPTITVGRRVLSWLSIDDSVEWDPVDPLQPMYAPPEYERPMYEPLSAISSDWILPGISQVKEDSIGLAVANQSFIEAYMAGLNSEMTRELLWNEFPTDQRGTYFRQFWSIASHILEDGSTLPPEQLRDIEPLRLWDKNSSLGEHSPRTPPAPGELELVLVLRAQLIHKYPNVIIYAQKLDAATQTLIGEQVFPIYDANIPPDIAFYGFQLTAAELRADTSWYFVLQEQPGEPKFADTSTTRNESNKYTTNLAQFGTSAGLIAEGTFKQPFRLGIQAIALLPPEAP